MTSFSFSLFFLLTFLPLSYLLLAHYISNIHFIPPSSPSASYIKVDASFASDFLASCSLLALLRSPTASLGATVAATTALLAHSSSRVHIGERSVELSTRGASPVATELAGVISDTEGVSTPSTDSIGIGINCGVTSVVCEDIIAANLGISHSLLGRRSCCCRHRFRHQVAVLCDHYIARLQSRLLSTFALLGCCCLTGRRRQVPASWTDQVLAVGLVAFD